jgi:hypothetical protein
MRRAFSALNGYQYEDAYKEQGLTPPFPRNGSIRLRLKGGVKPPHSKAPFGREFTYY